MRFLNAPYYVINIIIIIISSSSSSSSSSSGGGGGGGGSSSSIIIIIIISLDRTWYLCSNKSRFLLEIILVGDIPMMAPSYFSDINGLSSYQE